MKSSFANLLMSILVLLITGCATPVIDSNRFAPPKSVVIADFPDILPAATIQVPGAQLASTLLLRKFRPVFHY